MTIVLDVVICPGCDSPALPSSTVCGECGERLTPRRPEGFDAAHGDPRCFGVKGCTCLGGICTACVIFLLDNGLSL